MFDWGELFLNHLFSRDLYAGPYLRLFYETIFAWIGLFPHDQHCKVAYYALPHQEIDSCKYCPCSTSSSLYLKYLWQANTGKLWLQPAYLFSLFRSGVYGALLIERSTFRRKLCHSLCKISIPGLPLSHSCLTSTVLSSPSSQVVVQAS
jgi:hypothetical protein